MNGYVGAMVSNIDFKVWFRRKSTKTSKILHFEKCKIVEVFRLFLLNQALKSIVDTTALAYLFVALL